MRKKPLRNKKAKPSIDKDNSSGDQTAAKPLEEETQPAASKAQTNVKAHLKPIFVTIPAHLRVKWEELTGIEPAPRPYRMSIASALGEMHINAQQWKAYWFRFTTLSRYKDGDELLRFLYEHKMHVRRTSTTQDKMEKGKLVADVLDAIGMEHPPPTATPLLR